jgi:hypothetical protein
MPLAYLPSHCKLSLAPALSRDACWNCFSQDGTRTKLSAWQGNSHSPTEVMLKVVEPLGLPTIGRSGNAGNTCRSRKTSTTAAMRISKNCRSRTHGADIGILVGASKSKRRRAA